jgi:hypothetical protein
MTVYKLEEIKMKMLLSEPILSKWGWWLVDILYRTTSKLTHNKLL